MTEKDFNGQKFDLSQNSFVIFMLSYAPGLISGAIVISFCSFLPNVIQYIAYSGLIVVMLIKSIMALQYNKSTLVISDSSILIYLKKRKNNVLLTKIDNSEIATIKQVEEEGFIVTKKDGQEEFIPLSSHLKPYKVLLYSVKAALFKIYGEERTDFASDMMLKEYLNSKTFPANLLKEDKNTKSLRMFYVILSVIFAGLPTLLGLLAILLLILFAIMTILKGIIGLLSIAG